MKTALILLFFAVSHLGMAGTQLVGSVSDEQQRPVPFVSIGFVNTNIGTVSDMQGNFTLNLNEFPLGSQTLRLSCIGYQAIEIVINESSNEKLHITMLESITELTEVVVRPTRTVTKLKGNKSEDTAIKTNLAISREPNMNLGSAVGRRFGMDNSLNFLKTFKFFVAANNFDTVLVRVTFHAIEKGKPGKPLHQTGIYQPIVQHKRGWVAIDLSPYALVVQEDLIAVVEWVSASKKGNVFAFNISMPALLQTHYYKYGAQNTWKAFRNMSSSMLLEYECEK